MNKLICLAAAATMLAACNNKNQTTSSTAPDELVQHIDSAVKPGDDFFMFANGKWFASHPIPSSERSNGIFRTISDTINATILQICENAATSNNTKGSNEQKIGDYYFSGMDTATIEKEGLQPLKNEFTDIDNLKDFNDVMRYAAHLHIICGSPMLSMYINSDDKISSKNAIFLWQGGLGLPDRDYYFNNDQRTKSIREEYPNHLKKMFVLMGEDDSKAAASAADIYKVELALAKVSRKIEDLRDPFKNYNKYELKAFESKVNNLPLNTFLSGVNLSNADTVIVGQPEFFEYLNKAAKEFTINQWKNYLRWNLIHGMAPYLNSAIESENFRFYGTILNGTKEQRPRWKRVVEDTNGQLGELIGQVYVEKHLPKGTKDKLMEIGNAIKAVYRERMMQLDWMSDATKQKAVKKLDAIIMKVGYPDKWKDLSAMEIERTAYVTNVIRANQWHTNYMLNKYGKPVDRTEWDMTPQTYNAYYNPSNNEIVVPACNIIVPGYEKSMADDAILYSIIGGSTFGHEFTHGFDDQGSKYDEFGNLNNWWTPEDSARFYAKTDAVVKQYDQYVVVDSLHINGNQTQGENIADIGGIAMGLEAFKKTAQYKENKNIGGLNPSQRFFLGYAYAWMVNMRPEALATRVLTDVHSPAKFRVIGPLVNMPYFYETFGIKEGDKIFLPENQRVHIW
ncbi:MAG: M13 family metallopeptidase [Bacteroidetes bacterium]|jgi:putative endopeptidase|nr:M13 family metallopeptidase [Bacteroidota bacterium]